MVIDRAFGDHSCFCPFVSHMGSSLPGTELCQMCMLVTGWGESHSWFGHMKMGNLLRIMIRYPDCILSIIPKGF